jgi:hypothetical protein
MNMYWLFNLPIRLFGLLIIAVTVAIGLVGFRATRRWVRRVHGEEHSHNDIVGFYLAAICVYYGITLGLLAIGTWQAYSDMDTKVGEEASVLAALYRNVSNFPDPKRAELQADLREYAHQVIDVAWPLQHRGIVPRNDANVMGVFQTHLITFEPATEGQKALHAQTYRELDRIVELGRIRLQGVTAGLPAPLWSVVLVGAFLNIAVTWFFDMKSHSMHLWMTIMFSGLLGLLIFLLAAMESPFRGEISVGPGAFELVYEQLMKPGSDDPLLHRRP